MKTYTYKKIDAFASGGSTGNPAACLYLAPGQTLSPDDMLAVAQQHKGFVSEVVYCEPSDKADVKLTYYSSECEVDFCGHGTIACLYDLAVSDPRLNGKAQIMVETNKKGVLAVSNMTGSQDAVFITAPEAVHIGTALTLSEAAAALGLAKDRLSEQTPIDVINAGLSTLIIPVARLEDEISVFPDEASLKTFCETQGIDIMLIFSMETANEGYHAHTRVFAPRFGYLEDPATGSGNSAFGYYMLKYGLWDGHSIRIEQGGKDRVFNTVHLAAPNGCVQFGGSAVVRICGEYYI
jgi:PhzF family phenazine biosynthesis protein